MHGVVCSLFTQGRYGRLTHKGTAAPTLDGPGLHARGDNDNTLWMMVLGTTKNRPWSLNFPLDINHLPRQTRDGQPYSKLTPQH
jgi:hypothetical protein